MLSHSVFKHNILEVYNMKDIEYFNQVAESKEWSDKTRMAYKTAYKQYVEFCGKSFIKLLDEAYQDEEEKTPHYRLQLRNRLNSWINHLKEKGLSKNTISTKKNGVILLYKYAGIHIPELDKISGKSFNNNPSQQLQYEDIITREEIKKSLEIADSTIRALIITSAVTGSAKNEILSMKIRTFIEGTKEYHQMDIPKNINVEDQHNFIKKVLEKLDNFEDIVVTFKLVRAKVQKNYYTFCTPECSKHLICMLKERIQTREFYNERNTNPHKYIGVDDKLFKINVTYLQERLAILNDTLDLGIAGRYNKLNLHMLRRYFATTLSNPLDGDLDTIMPSEYIDAFEGRSKNSMISIYAKKNPSELKKVYMKYMYRLVIDLESYKFKDIEEENKELQLKVDKVDLLEDELYNIKKNYDLIFENNKKNWSSV